MDLVVTEDNFDEIFKPQINHIERAKQPMSIADEDLCSFSGQMYETFGEDIDYVFNLAKTTNRVWTIVEGDDDTMFYCAGFHYVNRIGFIVCEVEYKDGQEDIQLDTDF
jgi:hypothetical protein